MDAANFFSNATGSAKNPLRYNQFGGSLGGPIRRDKTFFFADYQGTITHNAAPMITSVPADAQRRGDFSACEPMEPRPDLRSIRIIAGADAISQATSSQRVSSILPPQTSLALLPPPESVRCHGQPLPFNNYAVTRCEPLQRSLFRCPCRPPVLAESTPSLCATRFRIRTLSHLLSSALPLGGSLSLGAGTTRRRNQNAGIGHIYQLKPTLINEVRIGLNRQASS